jgi:hypothetical protein
MHQPCFDFTYFSNRHSHFSLGQASDDSPPTCASCVSGVTGVHHCAQLVC